MEVAWALEVGRWELTVFQFRPVTRIPGMKGFLREPWVRLGLIVAVLLATLLALRLFPGSSNEQAAR